VIEIRRFAAANHNQSLTIDGTISQAGPQDLTLHVQSLPRGERSKRTAGSNPLSARLREAGNFRSKRAKG
jgi:hypothetical protein